ncbi:MAG TPA: endonuclease/exonuclease/phosphatase family protein [Pseudonocardiaceae bacterium]|nr:endonuclease/exonuclease/phosphatase family protein [Pseudonocardiaceae bacterium]
MHRRRAWLRFGLLFAVVCAVPAQGIAAELWPDTPAAAAASGPCDGATHGCLEVKVIRITGGATAATGRLRATVRELQLNLCNSGEAGCYHDNHSPVEAAGVVARYRPDVLTLDEICDRDILDPTAPLPRAMAAIARQDGDAAVFAYFTPALSPSSHLPYHCTDGALYGIGIIGRGPVPTTSGGHYVYQGQLRHTGEIRVAVCAAVGTGYDVCATHLNSRHKPMALNQCRQLLGADGFEQRFQAANGTRPVLVGGDFNLLAGPYPGVQNCVPAGWSHVGDGGVQHVIVGQGFSVTGTRRIRLHDTDHPGFLVDVTDTATGIHGGKMPA